MYTWCSQPLARRLYCNGLFQVSSFLSLDLENDTFAGLSIVPAKCIIVETMERGGGIGRRPLQYVKILLILVWLQPGKEPSRVLTSSSETDVRFVFGMS